MKNKLQNTIFAAALSLIIIILVGFAYFLIKDNVPLLQTILFPGIIISTILLFILFSERKKIEDKKQIKESVTKDKELQKNELEKNAIKEAEENAIKEAEEKFIEDKVKGVLLNIEKTETPEELSKQLLKNLATEFSIVQGIAFIVDYEAGKYKVSATYAYYSDEEVKEFSLGEGISGQVAKNLEMLNISSIPEDYITVLSGLGSSTPKNLLIFPLVNDFEAIGLIEVATFTDFPDSIEKIYNKISKTLGAKLAGFLLSEDLSDEEVF